MYFKHNDLSKYWGLDIEADSLTPTRIWVVVAINAATGEVQSFRDPERFRRFVSAHSDCYWVGHNAISFDVVWLNALWGAGIPPQRVVDTLTLSYLYDPRMAGGHSLEAWGVRMKFPKIDFHDYSQYSEAMHEYCIQDVRLTLRVFLALTERMRKRGFSEKSAQIEHDIRRVVDKQERNGFWFDIDAAERLYQRIREEQDGLAGPIKELFPPELTSQGTYTYRVRADGQPYASFERHLGRYPKLTLNADKTEYEVFDWQEFNIGSPPQRLEKLLSLGFKPTKKTKSGNPSVDEDALLEFAAKRKIPEVQAIAEWLVLFGRGNMINTWLNAVDRTDSRIHGRVFTCGAITRRMTHSSPNTANIPKAKDKIKYGKECRALWSIPDKERYRLVGYDASGLEMRMFGHYLGDPKAAELYIHGDPHAVNTANLGLAPEDRDLVVKNGFYAFLYGAQNARLDATFNRGRGFGKKAREILMETTPGLERAVREAQEEQQATGWIKTIDGGYVRCLSPHAALNSKLQSAGGITMKVASIILDEWCTEKGIDHKKVADVHDEGQHEVAVGDAEEFARIAPLAITAAGESLNFSVPLAGEAKIGDSWATTH